MTTVLHYPIFYGTFSKCHHFDSVGNYICSVVMRECPHAIDALKYHMRNGISYPAYVLHIGRFDFTLDNEVQCVPTPTPKSSDRYKAVSEHVKQIEDKSPKEEEFLSMELGSPPNGDEEAEENLSVELGSPPNEENEEAEEILSVELGLESSHTPSQDVGLLTPEIDH